MSFEFTGAYGLPGIQAALETVENVFWWGRFEQEAFIAGVLESTTVDTGNTGYTDVLRPGLLLGKNSTSGKLNVWDPDGTDGTQDIFGVLGYSQKMKRMGTAVDRWVGWVYTWGFLKADRLLIPGNADFGISGDTYEHLVRAQLDKRFTFSDQLSGNAFGGWKNVISHSSAYWTANSNAHTVTEAENNTLFTTKNASADITYTLPVTAKIGLRYGFYAQTDNALTVVAGTADTMVAFNDAAADSVEFTTAGDQIGGYFEVIGDGSKWLVIPSHWNNSTTDQIITINT